MVDAVLNDLIRAAADHGADLGVGSRVSIAQLIHIQVRISFDRIIFGGFFGGNKVDGFNIFRELFLQTRKNVPMIGNQFGVLVVVESIGGGTGFIRKITVQGCPPGVTSCSAAGDNG